jgi:hypothetical protein
VLQGDDVWMTTWLRRFVAHSQRQCHEDAIAPCDTTEMLVLDGVNKHFGAVRAVDGVSVKIAGGQAVAGGVAGVRAADALARLEPVRPLASPETSACSVLSVATRTRQPRSSAASAAHA